MGRRTKAQTAVDTQAVPAHAAMRVDVSKLKGPEAAAAIASGAWHVGTDPDQHRTDNKSYGGERNPLTGSGLVSTDERRTGRKRVTTAYATKVALAPSDRDCLLGKGVHSTDEFSGAGKRNENAPDKDVDRDVLTGVNVDAWDDFSGEKKGVSSEFTKNMIRLRFGGIGLRSSGAKPDAPPKNLPPPPPKKASSLPVPAPPKAPERPSITARQAEIAKMYGSQIWPGTPGDPNRLGIWEAWASHAQSAGAQDVAGADDATREKRRVEIEANKAAITYDRTNPESRRITHALAPTRAEQIALRKATPGYGTGGRGGGGGGAGGEHRVHIVGHLGRGKRVEGKSRIDCGRFKKPKKVEVKEKPKPKARGGPKRAFR